MPHDRAAQLAGTFPDPAVAPDPRFLADRVVLAGATVHVPDIALDPDFSRNETYAELGVRAVLGVPMRRGDDVQGVITLWKRDARPYESSAVKLVEAFATATPPCLPRGSASTTSPGSA